MELSEIEKKTLNSLKINELWFRVFDIGLDESTQKPMPLAIAEWGNKQLENLEITGCIFIENRVFRGISEAENEQLAERTSNLLHQIFANKNRQIRRVLIDCDWTASDRDGFFLFLKKLKKRLPEGAELAVTIRLHQFKNFEKTGYPTAADRAVLMVYNTGDVAEWATKNSILDTLDAAKFLDRTVDFPLPFEVALPIFRWGVVFRDGDFFKLINGLDSAQLLDNQRFTFVSKGHFEVQKPTFLAGLFLQKGDQIRLEASEESAIFGAARKLQKNGARPERVLFYHLDSANVAARGPAFFEKVAQIFD